MTTISTVKEYNSRQQGANTMFQNANGSFKKRGFVVEQNGVAQYCTTLQEAETLKSTGITVEKEKIPNYSQENW